MEPMDPLFATVEKDGQLVIPATVRRELGISPGSRVSFRVEGKCAVLEVEDVASKLQSVDEQQGRTANLPSGTELLLDERRMERARELTEEGW